MNACAFCPNLCEPGMRLCKSCGEKHDALAMAQNMVFISKTPAARANIQKWVDAALAHGWTIEDVETPPDVWQQKQLLKDQG